MTLLGPLFARSIEQPSVPITSAALVNFGDGSAGSQVRRPEQALGLSAVWRAEKVKTGVLSALPLHSYRDGTTKVPAGLQASDLLEKPHPDMTRFEWRQSVWLHRDLWGNAYNLRQKTVGGATRFLWPLPPSAVRVCRDPETWTKLYVYTDSAGTEHILTDEDIWHFPGMGYDGLTGVSPITAARRAFELGLNAEEFGAKFFTDGSLATGVLQTDQRLNEKQAEAIGKRWRAKRSGMGSAHETIILDAGAKFEPLTIPPNDAQFLETRNFQTTEICRLLGIPPFLMFQTEKSTSWGTGLEQQALGWVQFDINADLVALEQRLNTLLTGNPGAYAKHSIEGLLRGDSAARAKFYKALFELGALSTNEIREFEERGPVEGGDVRYVPLNMGVLGAQEPGADTGEPMAELSDAEVARNVTEMVQKVYLGVGKVISDDEARALLNRAGAGLTGQLPEPPPAPALPAPAEETTDA